MKLIPDALQGPTITGYGKGWVAVNGEQTHASIIISQAGHQPWDCADFASLQDHHFAQLIQLQPEIILFGSGDKHRFVHPGLLQSLYAQRIGIETMDTQAACRAYNFLSAEGRKVVAALLLEKPL
jgi:uncharacterized protein